MGSLRYQDLKPRKLVGLLGNGNTTTIKDNLSKVGFSEMEKNMENGIDTIRAEKLSLHLITQMVKTSEQLFRGTNV